MSRLTLGQLLLTNCYQMSKCQLSIEQDVYHVSIKILIKAMDGHSTSDAYSTHDSVFCRVKSVKVKKRRIERDQIIVLILILSNQLGWFEEFFRPVK